MSRLGLISDTHNYLDPQVLELFAGVERILHAGDVGRPQILRELEEIAPVTAVGGNTDEPGYRYPESRTVEFHGQRFFVHHIVDPHETTPTWSRWLRRVAPNVVVFGHTHRPFTEQIGSVLYVNPGAAGKSRWGQSRSVALLHVEPAGLHIEFCELRD